MSVEIDPSLPEHYVPNHRVLEGKMHVIGIKAKKISSTKAVLIEKFISPPFFKNLNVQIQLFCTSLELKTKQGQGTHLSIRTALKISNPGAKSIFDLDVRCKPRSDTTRSMIAAVNSMRAHGGTIFDVLQASSDDFGTQEQNPVGDETRPGGVPHAIISGSTQLFQRRTQLQTP